jgi:hypothetical protein
MDAVVEWVDARERLPRSGYPVAAAVAGRYRAEPGRADGAAERLGMRGCRDGVVTA